MSNILFSNNASTTLAAPINSVTTTAVLATGTGALFPNPSGGKYFLITFIDAATGLLNEIVKVTARSGDTLTIVRAQEGTSAQSWLAGDTAANLLTAGSLTAIQAGFPTSTSTVSTNTSLSSANAGTMYRVQSSAVMTLPTAASASGTAIGFSASGASCTISITAAGGTFQGGAPTASTSITLAAASYVCVVSNGSNWILFAASPDVFYPSAVALQSWVTANFDPLGAATTAQANAEAYADTLQGNLSGVHAKSATYNTQASDFGSLLILGSGTVANSTFRALNGTAIGQQLEFINLSTFSLTITRPASGSTAQFIGVGVPSLVTSFVIPPNGAATIIWGGVNWNVEYFTGAFDVAGAAAAALSTAEAYALSLAGSLSGVTSQSATYNTQASDFGSLLILGTPASGNATFRALDGLAVGNQLHFLNRSNFNLTITRPVSGSTAQFVGVGVPSLVNSFVIASGGAATIAWSGANWNVEYYTGAFDVAGAAAAVLAQLDNQCPQYAKTVSLSGNTGNNTTVTLTTQSVTFPASGLSATGGFKVIARASLAGISHIVGPGTALTQNFTLGLSDGTNGENGATWFVYVPDNGEEADIESSFLIKNVYSPGATVTFTLTLNTLGGGGNPTCNLTKTFCHLDIMVVNA